MSKKIILILSLVLSIYSFAMEQTTAPKPANQAPAPVQQNNTPQDRENCTVEANSVALAILNVLQEQKVPLYNWASSSETLSSVTGDDAIRLATVILREPKPIDQATQEFLNKLYAWKPDFKGASPAKLVDLMSTLFATSSCADNGHNQFAAQLFDLELNGINFEKISSRIVLKLMINLLEHPMTAEQENTKVGQFIINHRVEIQNALKMWCHIVLAMHAGCLDDTRLKSNFYQGICRDMRHYVADYHKNFKALEPSDLDSLILYLLKHMTPEEENSAVYQHLLLEFKKEIKHGTKLLSWRIIRCLLLRSIDELQNPSIFAKIVVNLSNHIITKLKYADELLVYLLQHPLETGQERPVILKNIIELMPAIYQSMTEYSAYTFFNYLVQNPLTLEQQVSELGCAIYQYLPHLMLGIRSEILFKLLSSFIQDPHAADNSFGIIFLETLPQVISKMKAPACGPVVLALMEKPMQPEQAASAVGKAIYILLPELIANCDQLSTDQVLQRCIQKPMTLEKENGLFARALVSALPRVVGGFKHVDDALRLLKFLLANPMTDKQKRSQIGQQIIALMPLLIGKCLMNSDDTVGVVQYFLNNPLTPEQEQGTVGQFILATAPILVMGCDANKLVEDLMENPIDYKQQKSWIGRVIVGAAPQLIQKCQKDNKFFITNNWRYALKDKDKFKTAWLKKAIADMVPQAVDSLEWFDLDGFIKNVERKPLVAYKRETKLGKYITQTLPVWKAKYERTKHWYY